MNLLFITQSVTLKIFHDVANLINDKELGKVGFYITDSYYYEKFIKNTPEFFSNDYEQLKEWEIIEKSKRVKLDMELLKSYENEYGDPVLWNVLMGDRYIFLGKMASLKQDYVNRFSHERMLAILQVAILKLESLFDRVKPDVVISFICATIGDYLAYLIARNRNIRFLNLRPTRIKNFFIATESVLEPSKRFEKAYHKMLNGGVPDSIKKKVSFYIDEIRNSHAMYEGVLPPGQPPSNKIVMENNAKEKNIIHKFAHLLKKYYVYNYGSYRHDNYYRGVFFPGWFKKVEQPIRSKKSNLFLKQIYVDKDKLESMDYAFYPLHKEPEVTLLVYSRPYVNQIEAIRNFARSLPIGMKLIVKEHPASVNYRPVSYYKKLVSIPNVGIVHPSLGSRELIQKARLVTVIAGSIGLEALMLKKPVIALGGAPYTCLPDNMVRKIGNLDHLGWDIRDLLQNHEHDEGALNAYIAAIMKLSVPVDFYSVLLGREGAYRPYANSTLSSDREEQLKLLASFLLNACQNENTNP